MFEGITNYPLSWPVTQKRTLPGHRKSALFKVRGADSYLRRHTIAEGIEFVLNELRLMGGYNIIVSSNLQVRADGLPKSNQRRPDDPGIAVYFYLKKQPRVLACDKWTTPEDNLWAIGKHVETVRGQERWGVGTVEQAFAGYAALPAPASNWWDVLGVSSDASVDEIRSAYRSLVKQNRPDLGENRETFERIQNAYEVAEREKGQNI